MEYYYNDSPYESEDYIDDYESRLRQTDSYDDYGDVIAGLSNMSLGRKMQTVDCEECFPCIHLMSCNNQPCSTCKDAVKAECQNKFCLKHQSRENDLKCDCSTERLLTTYVNHPGKEVYGWFKCLKSTKKRNKNMTCNQWNSAHAWVQRGKLLTQDCKKCEAPRVPFKARLKEWRGNAETTDESKQPHDQARCEMCKRKRRPCWYDN